MPTYDYRCRKCGHPFELFHSIKDDVPKRCPECKGRAERVPAAGAGILFKGSGFYTTDYRSKDYKKQEKQEKQEQGPSSGGGKSESGNESGKGKESGRAKESGKESSKAKESGKESGKKRGGKED